MRLKHKPWAKDYINEMSNIFINSYIDNNTLKKLLISYDQIHMEIGCGKGQFIYKHAKENPKNLYIAVERQASVIVTAAKKLEEEHIDNLKFYYGDIFNLNENNLLPNKIHTIYLNFSDPWPKNRHEKRRLTYEKFLNLYHNLLIKEGEIFIKTDNNSLFEYSINSIANHQKWFFQETLLNLHVHNEIYNIKTEYEERFSKQQIPIKYLHIKKAQ